MKKLCGNCEEYHNVIEKKEVREYEIKNTKIAAEIIVLLCDKCNEEVYDRETEIANDIILFDEYKKKHHLLTSSDIKRIRGKYNLSQTSFAKLLGFGLKTITRYENGSIQDVTHNNLMKLIEDERNYEAILLQKQSIKEYIDLFVDYATKSIHTKYEYNVSLKVKYTTTVGKNGGFRYEGC